MPNIINSTYLRKGNKAQLIDRSTKHKNEQLADLSDMSTTSASEIAAVN